MKFHVLEKWGYTMLWKIKTPPGISLKSEIITISSLIILGLVISIGTFVNRFTAALSSLYIKEGAFMLLDQSKRMMQFDQIMDNNLTMLTLVILGCLCLCVYHYMYYSEKTKSIYVMRRLPNRYTLHVQALSVPVLAILLCCLMSFMLILIYYTIYTNVTPMGYLPLEQCEGIWRIFI